MENYLSVNIGKVFKPTGEPISYFNNNYHHDPSYLFHLDYVVPAIKKRRVCWPDSTGLTLWSMRLLYVVGGVGPGSCKYHFK